MTPKEKFDRVQELCRDVERMRSQITELCYDSGVLCQKVVETSDKMSKLYSVSRELMSDLWDDYRENPHLFEDNGDGEDDEED